MTQSEIITKAAEKKFDGTVIESSYASGTYLISIKRNKPIWHDKPYMVIQGFVNDHGISGFFNGVYDLDEAALDEFHINRGAPQWRTA